MGAPIKDVTIPTGISEGEMITLAIVSETSRKIPPINILPGIEYLWSEPNSNFDMFGTIRPTKEIIPAIETAEAASIEDKTIDIYWSLLVFNPKETDNSFPSESTLNSLDNIIENIKPTNITGKVDQNSIQPFPESPPLSQ